MYNKALYLEYRGRYAEAWKLFKKYAKKAKPSAEVYHHIGKFCKAALDNDYDWAYSQKNMKPSYWFEKAKAMGYKAAEIEFLKTSFFKNFPSNLLESAKIYKKIEEFCDKDIPEAEEIICEVKKAIEEKANAGVIDEYETAAVLGSEIAQNKLSATLFYKDAGSETDKEALEWMILAADNGHVEAQFMLSKMYYSGIKCPIMPRKAFEYCKKAAENGHEEAMQGLAEMYYTGNCCEKNMYEAAKLFAKVADQKKDPKLARNASMCYLACASKIYGEKKTNKTAEGKREAEQLRECMILGTEYKEKAEEWGYKKE